MITGGALPPPAADMLRAAQSAMASRDARAARAATSRLTQAHPGFAPAWLCASTLELDLGQSGLALAACRRGLTLAPDDPRLHVQLVRCLQAAGQVAAARGAILAALPKVADDPALQHELGNACAATGDYQPARLLMDQAAALLPHDAALQFNLAAVLRFLGEFAQAEWHLNRAIALSPCDWQAYGTRSQLRSQTPDANHIAELEALLGAGIPHWAGAVQIHYALAKEYEDLGRQEPSFAHLAAGAALRRRHLEYDVGQDVSALRLLAETFTAAPPPVVRDQAGGPIFIFGLPRSGTTLVDRIISAHPQVTSLGELNDFPAAVIACAGGNLAKKQLIQRAASIPAAEIGAAYLARVAQRAPSTPWFIDKLPMNYLYAGLIAAALPGARLVHVTRHPMANGYAMLKTLFQQGYPFSYDQDDLGCYIAAYLRLMAHWRALLGSRLITVSYEALVASPEGESRAVLQACGLGWHDSCLAPHRNPAPTATHSAAQVRRPIYASSVHQWRHHAARLEKLRARLLGEGLTKDCVA